ncbi:MAG: phage scaffold protein, partial [Ruminococcaceae bacterium]|nr:phage scaffold protein [Oscillospiraceae bacterium]
MAEFTPITTQEQFDAAIGDRIKREHETIAKKYADYDDIKTKNAAYETQVGELSQSMKDTAAKYAGYDKTLADLQGKVAGYEKGSLKLRIANESGIPYELAQRLTG